MRFSTIAVHAGQRPDPHTGAVCVPVALTSTFAMDGIGKLRGEFEYARSDNPSRHALEISIAAIEFGKYALAFASGQASSTAVLDLLQPGDEIVTTPNVYGGTYRLFHYVYNKYNIKINVAANTSPETINKTLTEKTVLVWGETPSNPLLDLFDIAEVAERVHNFRNKKGTQPLLVIDNTFPSPAFQNPLLLGADIVTHSCTKYIGGHSDVIAGAIVVNDDRLYEKLKFYQNAAGAVPEPLSCFLLQRGIRTLPLRMKKHEENVYKVAEFLRNNIAVEQVFFPGFTDFPQHELVAKQMRGLPGMVSFKIHGGIDNVKKFFAGLKLIILAESLGGPETLICHPATMTHAALPKSEQAKIGITDNLIRLSVGLEDPEDLIEDLQEAFNTI
ncbi:MAG: PLP-dependent aspartate aminotransferase family protein [Planctomycetaceae bacterium]|jgi:cystathionine beta-lyase/cystathionine gamma-synthase|nr:PLP-dependent aspartate aminotransferase family protein [Planctomycetaceae bacterium]